ncbi:antichymotrypsin-2-like isoform X2 [Colias croceus]|uniref:antichymotrypsin-2-like isoform X2 n=1 Tax=Colias crocea TaxID=72248 RepID=UPI001E27E0A6|nr:antichymotrypsin-2-like isoform X2 [Colias croceus]
MRLHGVLFLTVFLKPVISSIMDSKALSSSIAQFSAKFCNELEKGSSVVASPLSAEFVLALLALGANDPSHAELLQSLGIPNDDAIRSSFSGLSSKLKSIKGVTLNVANKVYIQEGGYDLNPELKNDAIKVFDAGLDKLNFAESSAACSEINKWVEGKTNNRIKDLLKPDSVNSDTRLVLVNALFFKGTWRKQFDVANTIDQPFHIDESTTVDVPMMYLEDKFMYGESPELGVQFLRMDYVGNEASMLIVLPKEINGLDGVLKKLANGFDLMGELDRMMETKVRVNIPKFKIESEINLNELLPKLGISSIFDSGNSGIDKLLDNGELLYVSTAVQKAFIEVNEEGAEAAAATVMSIAMCSAIIGEPEEIFFTADRPFLAVILVDDAIYFTATHRGK